MLQGMDGGVPAHTTIDYVEGVSHDNVGMMNSAEGGDKVRSPCIALLVLD